MHHSRNNPKLSGHAILHGEFNHDATPLDPPGTRVIAYKKTAARGTWALHGQKFWYFGSSFNRYRCHLCYISKTRGECDSDCVEFFHAHHSSTLQFISRNATITALELASAIKHPTPNTIFSNIGDKHLEAITTFSNIFQT